MAPLTFSGLERLADSDETFRRINRLQLANDTRARRLDADTFAIRYKQTDIVLVHRDGSYTLNSGGYRTKITRERMNDYAPVRIMPGDNLETWYVSPASPGAGMTAFPFRDGIRVDRRGNALTTARAKQPT